MFDTDDSMDDADAAAETYQMIRYIRVPTLAELGLRRSDYAVVPSTPSSPASAKEESPEPPVRGRGVLRILREVTRDGGLWYKTLFVDRHTELVPFTELIGLEGGPMALEELGDEPVPRPPPSTSGHSRSGRAAAFSYRDAEEDDEDDKSEQEEEEDEKEEQEETDTTSRRGSSRQHDPPERELRRRRVASLASMRKAAAAAERSPTPEISEDELASPVKAGPATRRTRSKPLRQAAMLPYRGQSQAGPAYDSEDDLVVSDLQPPPRQSRKRRASQLPRGGARGKRRQVEGSDYEEEEATRMSARVTRRGMYTEPGIDDDYYIEADPQKPGRPRAVHSKEVFPLIEPKTSFGRKHTQYCETCMTSGPSGSRGNLVYCQGCSAAFHVECIGPRSTRMHLVTKTADDDFVMQCRRCINLARKKDPTAPDGAACQTCHEQGAACMPFSIPPGNGKKKGSAEATPDADVDADLLYNPALVLFRCMHCKRAWHPEHLDDDADARAFRCGDCAAHTAKIQTIRAWRPTGTPPPTATPAPAHLDIADYTEDDREYLVKFQGASYFRAEWLPGPWVWGVALQMRGHFVKKSPLMAWTTEAAVPESMFRIEIVYDVRYTSFVPTGRERDVDVARIGEVCEALVKWQGGEGGDVVWEVPPAEPKGRGRRRAKRIVELDAGGEEEGAEEEEVVESNEVGRWEDWRKAYEDFVAGHYVHLPKRTAKRREMVRGKSFKTFEKKEQPSYVVGGKLMKYQMDGMNWLYYKWHQGQTSILADEMGLGKTIQIISFLSIMVNDLSLYPFLIVVPHSTVPNWKREIQNWAPSMRVVAYYGSSESRALARKYELFHQGTKSLKCHIVVTSYSTPVSDSQYLRGIPWEALIVDEGQRLKNDESLLYKALDGYRIRHKVLMTGTPLQNNPRELFNLLQFLDPGLDAKELEEEYGDLDSEKVRRLHELIRPFFLRRTKREVLAFLPPMAEVIVPVTMSSLQRKLYKSILAQDPVLIKSIFRNPGDKSKMGNLRNVLMQLRKVLGHPFFYSDAIEDRGFDQETLHRNLIEAGSKLELLNIMLPKLKARGHRVLMFSQFLGMLDVMEDFLAGLGMAYQRLDGGTNTQEKQRRIDAFNRPGSKDFAFLLSTRAGGVGINLATADTVIILDPDFNPHQDIQALSRAHRIGQKNKVLVFHLVTRDTAEEKIMQIGKKKLSLDHLIIERMGAEGADDDQVDVESVLRFGARALFEDEGALEERRIRYDEEGVERLLERSAVEETRTQHTEGAEANAFSFARVWASEKGALEEGGLAESGAEEEEEVVDVGFWDKLLAEREEAARAAAAAAAEELGRGKRRRKVDYSAPDDEYNHTTKTAASGTEDDGEFRDEEPDAQSESDAEMGVDLGDGLDGLELQERIAKYHERQAAGKKLAAPPRLPGPPGTGVWMPPPPPPQQPNNHHHRHHQPASPPAPAVHRPRPRPSTGAFQRVELLPLTDTPGEPKCKACGMHHPRGECKLKVMGAEYCPLCGLAHFGKQPGLCAHLGSEGALTAMLRALRESTEDRALVREAKAYITGRKGGVKRKSTGAGAAVGKKE